MPLTNATMSRLGVLVALTLALGCATKVIEPATSEPSLQLELSLSSTAGAPGSPVTVRAMVRNTGWVPVTYFSDCYVGSPAISVWEPDRHNVELPCGHCPNALCVACAAQPATLKPGEKVDVDRIFEGQLYTCDGRYDVADGNYQVEVTFNGTSERDGTPITLTRSAVIHWSTH